MSIPVELVVNGRAVRVEADPGTPLLWVLREQLQLTGTKFGCGIGACGACTVHVNGVAARSCVLPVSGAAGSEITTIEGLGTQELHPVQQAWVELQVPQCGYCQPGMIMAVASALRQSPDATDQELEAAITNLCRCGTYPRIRRALKRVGST